MQSYLSYGISASPVGPITRVKQMRVLIGYSLLWLIGGLFVLLAPSPEMQTFGLGLFLPGLGFLPNFLAGFDVGSFMLLLAGGATFALSLVIWFATGNVILPCVTWLGLALLAMWTASQQTAPHLTLVPILFLGVFWAHRTMTAKLAPRRRSTLNAALKKHDCTTISQPQTARALNDDDLACLRLLLDRALQPVEDFNGFDTLDQFQTAALRYQLNFISYALSMVQATTTPAFKGYMHQAQSNLNSKQEDPRIWGYWKLENMWGNLGTSDDPFARDNIMYSGFVAAQLMYQRKAVTYPMDDAEMTITCRSKTGQAHVYSIHRIVECLVAQYRQAEFGLLPCEPNWIYPLCNAITATAIRAYDAAYGTGYWADIAPKFSKSLEAEFVDAKGRLVPFRSAYTGFAPPAIGGVVMQSFPCLYLNSVLPDVAQRQWAAMQISRGGRDWSSVVWSVDVGNYRFSRAAGFAASAAPAKEMGDLLAADELAAALDRELPKRTVGGIAHRPKASIWAHANEMLSRVLQPGALNRLVTQPVCATTPYLKSAKYPDVLVAKAIWQDDVLTCTLVPGVGPTEACLTIAGLTPHARYVLSEMRQERLIADASGEAALTIKLERRTTFTLKRSS